MKENKYKNIYLVVLVVITVCAIIFGVVYRVVGLTKTFRGILSKETKDVTTVTLDLDDYSSVNIDADLADLSVEYGDSYKLTYSYPEKIAPECSVENGILSITEDGDGSVLSFGNVSCKIILQLPEGTVLDTVDIDVDAGNVELEKMTLGKLVVDADAGNIEITDSVIDEVTMEADAGNVELKNVVAQQVSMKADAGNVETNGGNIGVATLKADLGNVEVRSEFESLEMECSLGEVSVSSDSVGAGKHMDLKTSLGRVVVNGKDYSTSYNQ